MIAALSFNAPELAEKLVEQLPKVSIIEVETHLVRKNRWFNLEKNEYWVGNWAKVFDIMWRTYEKKDSEWHKYPYVWMVNDDIEGASMEMYRSLIETAKEFDAFMVTPSFNSPHKVFHSQGEGLREVNWIDMTAPLIDLRKYWALGGFDKAFTGYGADIDLAVRAREKDYKMIVDDELHLHHIGGYSVAKNNTWEQSNLDHMNEILMKKYGKVWHELI